jgi:hypothetical protein
MRGCVEFEECLPALPNTSPHERPEQRTDEKSGAQCLFPNSAQRIYRMLWALWGLPDSEPEYFRTINVQWISQWSLFSRCSDSWNQ